MEFKTFATLNYSNKIRYRHLHCSCKSFIQHQRKTRQRLIPLTEEIIKTMADLNATPSSTSVSDKQLYNTLSITRLVREEVHNNLPDLYKYICKDEIYDLIENCLKGKTTIIQDSDDPLGDGSNEENDEIPDVFNDQEKNKLIVENLQILEQRITNVEKRLSGMMHNNPKLRANKLKLNKKIIKDEICSLLGKIQIDRSKIASATASTPQCLDILPGDELTTKPPIYDDVVYFERRENLYNLLNYKKSLTTLQLNEKVNFNPYVKPILTTLPDYRQKVKQRTTFIV